MKHLLSIENLKQSELEQILADHFRARPRDEWLKVLGEAGVPAAPVNNLAEVTRYPQLLERQMVLHADHPKFPDLLVPGSPLKSVGEASIPNTRAPDLGEHTDEVLSEFLGYSAARIAHLRADGVI